MQKSDLVTFQLLYLLSNVAVNFLQSVLTDSFSSKEKFKPNLSIIIITQGPLKFSTQILLFVFIFNDVDKV